MKAECTVVLIRQSGVRAVRMQHLEETAEEALAIGGHLISGRGQKPLFGEQCASIFRGLTVLHIRWKFVPSNVIEQPLKKRPHLGVCSSPIASGTLAEFFDQ